MLWLTLGMELVKFFGLELGFDVLNLRLMFRLETGFRLSLV